MLSGLRVDLGRYLLEIAENLLGCFQSNSTDQREQAASIIQTMSASVSSADVVKSGFSLLFDVLSGKKVRLTKWEQKQSVLAAMEGLSCAKISSAGKTQVAELASEKLLAQFDKVLLVQATTGLINCFRNLMKGPKQRYCMCWNGLCVKAKSSQKCFCQGLRCGVPFQSMLFMHYRLISLIQRSVRMIEQRLPSVWLQVSKVFGPRSPLILTVVDAKVPEVAPLLPSILKSIGEAKTQVSVSAGEEVAYLSLVVMKLKIQDSSIGSTPFEMYMI